ncbi:amidohydrolase family protein [Lysobacter sp. Root494]|uniref:amidohydrolase family protein n=1 Tax=Lysobacter sp. Root494 TaxID=1736549 RepID=UPI0006FE03A6|nr:amidohydrolase family protein [Lysobacter sp. Root494]KQY52447.1 amidohydrolase [Lysobacter sp. Root494]
MTQRIDAHQHFWRYDAGAYPWMSAGMGVLRRNWMPQDLRPLLDAQGIDGCIAVQARTDEAETDFLLELTRSHDWVAAVIGWVDLRAEDLDARLERWAASPALAGFRHLLQDDPDVSATLADTHFNLGVKRLQAQGHVYEVLVRGATQLAETRDFCARHDRHWLVLDHLGKPAIGGNEDAEWRNALTSLAAMPHVLCKVSGLVTEVASQSIDEAEVRRYLDVALELFGPSRLLFGSDWPVCLLRASYSGVCRIIEDWTAALSPDEQSLVWGGNAVRCYGLRLGNKTPAEPAPWT